MQEILAIALRSMQQDVARLDQIGTNLANVATPAYKRQVLVSRADQALAPSFARAMGGVAASQPEPVATSNSVQPFELSRDLRPGTLRVTSRDLDVAIGAAGYFEVLTPEGPAYTRQGEFQLDARGRLVTAAGYAVQGQAGDITLSGGPFTIDTSGRVTQDGRMVDRLKVVAFDARETLRPKGSGLFAAGAHPVLVAEADLQVRQGFLENSNVQQAQEMVELIQTMRHFESIQRVVQGYDDLVGSAIRKLGDA
jgi:flagellar basal-body rod protein FlgG